MSKVVKKFPTGKNISLKYYLDKIVKKETKDYFVSLLKNIMDVSSSYKIEIKEEVTVEQALMLLGKAHALNAMLIFFNSRLMDHVSHLHYIQLWPRELWEMKLHNEKSIQLAQDLVKSVIFHQTREDLKNGKLKHSSTD